MSSAIQDDRQPAQPQGESTSNADWVEKDIRYVVHPVTPADGERVVLKDGHGCTLVAEDGREFLDAHAGAWLVQVGHGRREIADAVHRQLSDFAHFSLRFGISNKPVIALSERLVALAPDNIAKVRYCTSGSEADDEALQIARYYHAASGHPERTVIITLRGAYHGRTVAGGALAAHLPLGMEDQFPGMVVQVAAPTPYRNDCPPDEDLTDYCIRDLERTIAQVGPERIAAMFGEPALGPAGMIPLPADYWPRVQEVLHRNGILLVMDEVVTGIGRTGQWLASSALGLRPDVILLAKGLASGYMPIGAILLSGDVAAVVDPLPSGGSYGGHAASCAAAVANLDIIEREGLLENARARGAQFLAELQPLLELPVVGDVHGVGLMLGIDLVADKATKQPLDGIDLPLTQAIRDESGVLLNVSHGTIVIMPPLVITAEEVTRVVQAIRLAVERLDPDGTLHPPAPTSQPRKENPMHEEIVAAVTAYVEGVRTADPTRVKDAFRADGTMWGYLGDQFVTMSAGEFAEQVVATSPAPDDSYSYEIHSVSATGDVASAVLDEKAYLGANFRNYFGLVRSEGTWRIASKVFTTVGA
ncbi:aminotransferase class III-fold pyridoxal phosphate-dependent enzyme [Microbacterium sp.]|uniref:aminotransferase class III-fold pyridoxal phosphate-dependent enzyme n=1 Tax=Microbacterium sp. TaxID=51671 RepID=UPI0039E32E7C